MNGRKGGGPHCRVGSPLSGGTWNGYRDIRRLPASARRGPAETVGDRPRGVRAAGWRRRDDAEGMRPETGMIPVVRSVRGFLSIGRRSPPPPCRLACPGRSLGQSFEDGSGGDGSGWLPVLRPGRAPLSERITRPLWSSPTLSGQSRLAPSRGSGSVPLRRKGRPGGRPGAGRKIMGGFRDIRDPGFGCGFAARIFRRRRHRGGEKTDARPRASARQG